MKARKLLFTAIASLSMCGLLTACNDEEETSTSGPEIYVPMSSLGYADVNDYESLLKYFKKDVGVPESFSYVAKGTTAVEYTNGVTKETDWRAKGVYNPIEKKFSFEGENFTEFLYECANSSLEQFKPKDGKYYQFGISDYKSTAKKPYCIVEITGDDVGIYEYDTTGHLVYLKFSPTYEKIKTVTLERTNEFEYSKVTVESNVEYHIKKHVGNSKDNLLLPKTNLSSPITTIKKDVFKDKEISKVFYMGTEIEFAALTIEEGNDCIESATKYFYSEEKPVNKGNYFHFVDGELTIYK